MKRPFLLSYLLLNCLAGWAQGGIAPSRWTPHVDSIFQYLDRSQVSTGLLVNYGVALKDYAPF